MVTCQYYMALITLFDCFSTDCGEPPFIANSFTDYSGTTFGSYANYTCIIGYYMSGFPLIYCDKTGKWTEPIHTCTIKGL